MNIKPLTKSYIESRSIKVESGCWEWTGCLHVTGYGELRREKKRILAHRLSFFLWNGYWPEVCRHKCDNRKCVNPDHLEDGTHADNVRDRDERRRGKWHTNEDHHLTKYTDDQVRQVHDLRAQGWTQQRIADEIGMHQTNVSRILRGQNRKIN